MVKAIKKVCATCGKEFEVPIWRESAKYCSKKCSGIANRGKDNAICTNCGKSYHVKPYQLNCYARHMGIFCSKSCLDAYRKIWFCGTNNHQYGKKGVDNSSFKGSVIFHKNHGATDMYVYAPYRVDANKDGRITEHRLIVEENWKLFPNYVFDIIRGQHVLKNGYDVHHRDGNHQNNSISNLQVVSRQQHTSLHNKEKIILRDSLGRIKKIVKQKELSKTERGTGGYGSTGK